MTQAELPDYLTASLSLLDDRNVAAGISAREKGAGAARAGVCSVFYQPGPVAAHGGKYCAWDIEKLDGPPIAKFDCRFELEEFIIGYSETKRGKIE